MSYLRQRPQLLQRFRCGDRDALEEVYRAYLPSVTTALRRGFTVSATGLRVPGCVKIEDLSDALQEVFSRAFARTARLAYDGERDYAPYLAAIARNAIVTRHRRTGRELLAFDPHSYGDSGVVEGPDVDVSDGLDPRALEVTRNYVSSLGEPLRSLHDARYVAALSQRDAAKQLGLSRPKVRKLEDRLRRGLEQLLMQTGLGRQHDDDSTGLGKRGLWTGKARAN